MAATAADRSDADEARGDPGLVVLRLTTALWVVAAIRLAAGLAFLAAAAVLAGDLRLALTGFAAGAFLLAFAALFDPRRRSLSGRKPQRRPLGSTLAPLPRVAQAVVMPSTVGVSVLAAIALATGRDVLGALLGGALAGMGIAAAVSLVAVVRAERRSGEEYVRFLTKS